MDWEANQKWLKRLIRVKCQQCAAKMDTWDFPGFSHIFVQGQRHGGGERGREAGGVSGWLCQFSEARVLPSCSCGAPMCVCRCVWVCVCVGLCVCAFTHFQGHPVRHCSSLFVVLVPHSSFTWPPICLRRQRLLKRFTNELCMFRPIHDVTLGRQPSFIY